VPKRGTLTILAQATDLEGNAAFAEPVTIRVKKRR
jgi:hypothetical protein